RELSVTRRRSLVNAENDRACDGACAMGAVPTFVRAFGHSLRATLGSSAMGSRDASASRQIDAIVRKTPGWRGERLGQLPALIRAADPGLIEEVKWKKPSRPDGVPVWSHDGIVCIGESLKNAVRLTFPKGALLKDPKGLFNSRLDSKSVRAVDFHEDDAVNA